MRFIRVFIGIVLIVGAALAILGEQLTAASSDALINAPLTTVRAAVAGDLKLANIQFGARVDRDQRLGNITDVRTDPSRLEDLLATRENRQADLASKDATLSVIHDMIARLERYSATYRDERIRQLAAAKDAAAAKRDSAQQVLDLTQSQLGRAETLAQKGVKAASTVEETRIAVEQARQGLKDAQMDAVMASIDLAAGQAGMMLNDGYTDIRQSEQSLQSLRLRAREAQSAQDVLRADIETLDQQIEDARHLLARNSTATLTSNVDGRLWQRFAADGETVQRGQDLLELVDCNSTIVTLSVSESVYNSLQMGDRAQFRPRGYSKTFDATIIRLAGPGAESVYQNLAIAPSRSHLERYDVMLQVPGLQEDAQLRCGVGRTGRVFFDRKALNWLRFLWS